MIKLYRTDPADPAHLEYWEAWAGDGRRVVLHRGPVGEIGLTAEVRVPRLRSAEKVIAAEAEGARAEGYAEIAPEAHSQVVVQMPMGGDLDADFELIEQVEGICNEVLGWTGNGACDGHDLGAGTINVFNEAVLADVAVASLVEALSSDGPPSFLVAVREPGADELEVRWPGSGPLPM